MPTVEHLAESPVSVIAALVAGYLGHQRQGRERPSLPTRGQIEGAAAVTVANATAAAWATANLSVSNTIATVGKRRVAFGMLGATIIGWEIGTWLSKKFAVVRKADIFMVQALVTGFEYLRCQWEVLAEVFSSNTIAEAAQRHE